MEVKNKTAVEFCEGLGCFSLSDGQARTEALTQGPDSDSFPWVRSWESFLSGPRVAGSPSQGKGVTFLGVKFNYPAGECV